MRFEHAGGRARARRPTNARVALVVCTAATAIVLVIDQSVPAIMTLVGIAVALGAYWWMVVAETRRPSLTLRGVIVAVAAVFAVALSTGPRESGDIWSYEIYGRMVAVHHASPYRHVPAEFVHDPLFRYVSPAWQHTGSVYGPAFTAFSAAVSPLAGDSAVRARFVYQATAALAMAAALWLLWRRTRSPSTLAWLGLHPVIALHVVNGGRNDALIGLGILGAALFVEREKLWASGLVTGVAAVIKATAGLAGAGLAVWTWRRRGLRRAVVLGAALVATVAIAYALAGGTVALGPLDHAAGQVSQGSVWYEPTRLGLPAAPTMVMTLMTAVIVAVGIWRRARDDPAEAGIAGPASFLLAAPYVLPGYLGWVLPGAAIHPARRTSRIVALQATLLVAAYAVFHHQLQGVLGDAIVKTTGLVTPLLGVALLVAYLRTPGRRQVLERVGAGK
jgi:Glycosyltransferase family 87